MKKKVTNRLLPLLIERGMTIVEFRRLLAARLGREPDQIRALVSNWTRGEGRINQETEGHVRDILNLPPDPLYAEEPNG